MMSIDWRRRIVHNVQHAESLQLHPVQISRSNSRALRIYSAYILYTFEFGTFVGAPWSPGHLRGSA